ncbi:MAG: beta-galactosidase trimerization domain-containing protein [Candidatus Omnitrophica bacterium]|nr:beta-galactosidase trimerization domain-containing protein [Candidatus Omnitrophota bacterium]
MKKTIFLIFIFLSQAFAEKIFFEAEDMTVSDTQKWQVVEHFPGWYYGFPSNGKMLRGSIGGQAEAKKTVEIKKQGDYKLWVRYLDILPYRGPFKVRIIQQGDIKAEKVFDNESLRSTDEGRKKWGDGYGRFVWDCMDVNLQAGSADIIITKVEPPGGASWVTRHLDLVVLCDEKDYQPVMADFIQQLYMKVKIGSNHKYPCVIHIFGRRPQPPWFLPHSNIYKTGLVYGCFTGYKPDGENPNFLKAKDETPWINITSFFDVMGEHKMELMAMQEYYTGVESSEFTVFFSNTPSDDGIFKSFSRSGKGSGMMLLIDLAKRDRIISDLEGSVQGYEIAKKLPDVGGKRPEKFPVMTGCAVNSSFYQPATLENEIFTLSKMGFNSIGGYDPIYYKAGFTKYKGGATYFHQARNGCLADPIMDGIKNIVSSAGEKFAKEDLFKDMVAWSQMDEPGSVSMDHIVKCDNCHIRFREFLRKMGVTPESFGVVSYDQVLPSSNPENGKKYYYTALYRNQVLADFFKIGTDILKNFTPDPKTTANFGEYLTYTGNMLHSGDDWFLIFDTGALTFGWTEDWLNHGTTYQLCGYRADFLRAASKNRFGMYCIFRNPWDTQAKVACEIGHGAKAIYYYNYGPFYAGIDCPMPDYSLYSAVQKINCSIGSIEDYLMQVSVQKSPVAILYSHTTDIWTLKQSTSLYGKERMGLWLILRHLGYPVEIITEKDVIEKKLRDYKAIFVVGSHLPAEVMQNLLDWTTNGGILYLGAGTGIYDRFNNPSNIDRYFGITREQFNFVSEPGNDYYGLPSLRAIDSVKFSDSTKSETIEVFCGIQKMKDTTGFKSIASFSDGSPAIVVKKKGRGKIVFSGFFPGITYMRSAVLENRKKEKDFLSDCPPSYPESIRDLFTKIVSDINYVPVVLTDNYLVEANFLEGKNADIIAISNWSGKVVENLELTVNRPVKGKPISTENSIKSVKVLGKQTIVKVSLTGAFDFILLPK